MRYRTRSALLLSALLPALCACSSGPAGYGENREERVIGPFLIVSIEGRSRPGHARAGSLDTAAGSLDARAGGLDTAAGSLETKAGAVRRPCYSPYTMVRSLRVGIFGRLQLSPKLDDREYLQLIRQVFCPPRRPGREGGLRLVLPGYFERGALVIEVTRLQGPPERFAWISNALAHPVDGSPLRGRGAFAPPDSPLRNIGGEILAVGTHLLPEEDLYSPRREQILRARGQMLALAEADIHDELASHTRRGRAVAEAVLRETPLSSERRAAALCILARYRLKQGDYAGAREALSRADSLGKTGPVQLRRLLAVIEEEYRLAEYVAEEYRGQQR